MAQGHPDQWLGYLSQCGLAPCGRGGVPLDARLVVNGRDFTVADLLSQAQADIAPGQEATWTLMAFSSYLMAMAPILIVYIFAQKWVISGVMRGANK